MELEVPLPCFQQPATCPYLEPEQTNPSPSVLCFEDPIYTIPPSMPRSSSGPCPSGIST